MIRAMWNSRSGMQAMQEKLDGISNNISNVDTNGYKKVNVSFNDLVYEQLERNGYPTNKNGVNQHLTGSGVKANEWIREDKQGPLKSTGVDTDLAIDGQGYFKVTKTDGTTAYTRSGDFNLDVNGDLVTPSGERVEIQYTGNTKGLTKGKFSIDEDGVVSKTENGNSQKVGKINLYNPVGQDAMVSVGGNLYVPKTGVQVNAVTSGSSMRQGFVEASNVDLASEMTDMIVTQRAFELNSKGLSTADQMMGIINNLRNK